MEAKTAIRNLEDYIKTIKIKTPIYTCINKEMNVGNDERIQSAIEQIELYKVGKGRLQY